MILLLALALLSLDLMLVPESAKVFASLTKLPRVSRTP